MVNQFNETKISGLILVKTEIKLDKRGYFLKDFDKNSNGYFSIFNIQETFLSYSKKNVLRGLHFQYIKPQTKIISCIFGSILDVVVDLRNDSPTFGKHQLFNLSNENHDSLIIPKGCAHGFLALTNSLIVYKCDEVYDKQSDSGIIYNDVKLNIAWPINRKFVISDRDLTFKGFNPDQIYFSKIL
jgi:dTDP-4-dehydrorhamnose 3,5-epimerase